jgi:hypothetical protein
MSPIAAGNVIVERPTDGLEFLKSVDRLDLSAEKIALNPRYKSILTEDIGVNAAEKVVLRGGDDTKMLFLSGSIEHGWSIHAKKLRRALRANSRAGRSRLFGAAGGAFFEKETR